MSSASGRLATQPGETANAGGRRRDIQGLRAIAVLMVVAFHAGLPVPGGFVGVDVFFVISGFVITAMLLREWGSTGKIRLGRFYVRRFKRLTPALALTVAVTMLLGVFFLSPLGTQQDTSRTGIGAMLLAANLVIAKISGGYFDLDAESNALLNTWSLSVEEQFYLLFPALLMLGFAIAKRHRHARWVPGGLVLSVGAVSFLAAMLGASGYVLPRESWLLGFYSPVTRAWEFAAGAILALFASRLYAPARRIAGALAVAGVALLAVSLFVIDGNTTFPGPLTLLPVLGTMSLILAGEDSANPVVQLLSVPTMVRVGDWSYSIYLWHWPLIVIASLRWPDYTWVAPAAAAFSLVPALASYRWVEAPIRAYTPATRLRLVGLVMVTVSIPLFAATALWQASVQGFGIQKVKDFQSAIFAQPEVCPVVTGLSATTVADCTWNPDAQGPPIYLLGDSNAGQFIDAVASAGVDLDRPVIASTTNACPFIDVALERLDRPDSWNAYCRAYTRNSMDFLSTADSGTVIVSNIDTYWEDSSVATVTSDSVRSVEPSDKYAALEAGLVAMIDDLESAGHDVVVVQTIPRWSEDDTWRTASCTVGRIVADACRQTMQRHDALDRQAEGRRIVVEAVSASDARVLDTWNALCPGSLCSTQGDNGPRYYRDGLHVSVPEGRSLAPIFEEVLRTTDPTES